MFSSRWPWSDLSRSPKVKLIIIWFAPYIISYTCVIVTIALSRTENLFLSRWPWSGLLRSPNVKMIIYHLICAISLFLYMFYRNYSAISHGKPVFQQMALIWAFKVTIGQTDYTIWFAPYHFLYTCFIVTIAQLALARTENLFLSRWPWSGLPRSPKVKLIIPIDLRHIISSTCFIVTI